MVCKKNPSDTCTGSHFWYRRKSLSPWFCAVQYLRLAVGDELVLEELLCRRALGWILNEALLHKVMEVL
jgi:hypothetical protein